MISDLLRTIQKYGRMKNLDGYTPQTRGQSFNNLISELFNYWNIKASPNLNANGEIDVVFTIDGRHFILEAKWEKDKTDTGKIAKLQKRVRQRLGGTVGIFLSMAGFSDDAIKEINKGEQSQVFCLSKIHFEAMLSGFIPPCEMIDISLKKASYEGNYYVKIEQFFLPQSYDDLTIKFSKPDEIPQLLVETSEKIQIKVIASELPFGTSGIAEINKSELLLTTEKGLLEVDIPQKGIKVLANIPKCYGNPIVFENKGIFIARNSGIARISNKEINFIAGGLTGSISIFDDEVGGIWAFGKGDYFQPDGQNFPVLLKIGSMLGDQLVREIKYKPGFAQAIHSLPNNNLLIFGNSVIIYGENDKIQMLISPKDNRLTNTGGVVKLNDVEFLVVCNDVELWIINIKEKTTRKVAKLALQGSAYKLIKSSKNNEGYILSHYSKNVNDSKAIILLWKFL